MNWVPAYASPIDTANHDTTNQAGSGHSVPDGASQPASDGRLRAAQGDQAPIPNGGGHAAVTGRTLAAFALHIAAAGGDAV